VVPAPDKADDEWLNALLQNETGWKQTSEETLTGLTPGDYVLCIRDAQDKTNTAVAVTRSFAVGSDAITFETQVTKASHIGAADGSIRVQASGGRGDYSGRFQFIARPMDGKDSELIAVDHLTDPLEDGTTPVWQHADLEGGDLSVGVLDGLKPGWYQVAVRTMESVSQKEMDDLQAAYDALLAAQTLVNEANAALTLSELAKAEKQLLRQIETALAAWDTAPDSEKAQAEAAYKALIGNDQTVLDALAAWKDATGRNKASKQRVYNAVVAAYVKKTVKATAEVALKDAEAVLANKEMDYRTVNAALNEKINAAYVTDSSLWDSAYTTKVYVGYVPRIILGIQEFDCDGGAGCPAAAFLDVDTSLWYHEALDYVIENGLMNGVSDSRFDPNSTMTRAMIVTILWRLEGQPMGAERSSFADVVRNSWYSYAVDWAAAFDIVEGYSETAFGPNDPITREQMAAIMWRYAKYKGYDVSVGENTNILSYDDAFDVSDWAIPAMQWACGAGLINGIADGNTMNLEPKGNATRAQAAAILQRFCENVANKE